MEKLIETVEKALAEASVGPWEIYKTGFEIHGAETIVMTDRDTSEEDMHLIVNSPEWLRAFITEVKHVKSEYNILLSDNVELGRLAMKNLDSVLVQRDDLGAKLEALQIEFAEQAELSTQKDAELARLSGVEKALQDFDLPNATSDEVFAWLESTSGYKVREDVVPVDKLNWFFTKRLSWFQVISTAVIVALAISFGLYLLTYVAPPLGCGLTVC